MRLGHKKAPTSAQREVRVTNKLGLHARPAAQFVKRVRSFRSEIWVVKAGNLDCGATATLEAHGVDADDALDELEKLLAEFHEKEAD
jgi:phosphocarrier protein HPr